MCEKFRPMIKISDLCFGYPSSTFRLVIPEWTVESKSQVAIIGPSGSGKTTLLHLLAGILRCDRGTIRFGNRLINGLSEKQLRDFRASQIGLVFQRFELIDYLNVRRNILLPFSINHALSTDPKVVNRLHELAERTGITSLLERPIQKLSQGEQQRVAICRALITQPKIVLADEPTGNLDPENKQVIVDLLKQQAAETDAILIMVTHDVSLVSQFEATVDFQQWRQVAQGVS